MRRVFLLPMIFLICLTTVSTLQARDYVLGWGARAGATLDPEQVHVGFHLDLGDIAERLRLQPNVEIGFGDNKTLVAINPEVFYLFTPHNRWTPYAGGGLGINIVNWDDKAGMSDKTETEIGLNLLGGVETRISDTTKFFGEIKFGVGDSPDAKFAVGLTFLM
jgi:opacity protein-like surface antigen